MSRRNARYSQAAIIAVWLGFTFSAFAYFTANRLVEFDPLEQLANIDNTQFIDKIEELTNLANHSNATLIHFSQKNCSCNSLSSNHKENLNLIAAKAQLAVTEIELTNSNQFIPSTPAVAIISEKNELVYFGPYGQGISCGETQGFAQTAFENYLKGYSANLIADKAKGCYCQTS